MHKKIRVVCLVNSVGASSIPLENFAAVDSKIIDKHLVVFYQSKSEAEAFIDNVYPKANFHVHSCSGRGWAGYAFNLWRIFRRLQPDVVHAHHTGVAATAAFLFPFLGFRFLTTLHSTFSNYSFTQKAGFGLSFLMSDQIICNSKNTLVSLPFFVKNKDKRVIYNGINFQEIDRAYTSKPNVHQGLRIGTICRMIPSKNLGTLIRAFVHIVATPDLVDVELRLVGNGPEYDYLKVMANKLGLMNRVRFTGALSRRDAYQELVDMDIFVVSSRWEGFCNAMVEAAAAGKAVVASNIQPLPEVIGEENAIFFKVGEDKVLAQKLKKLCEDKELRKTLGENAKAYVRMRYPIEKSAREYMQVYETLARR